MAVVLFDGVCNLCNGAVRFIIARDPRGRFRFASLGSAAAARALADARADAPLPDSVALVENGRVYTKSAAALRIVRRLRFPWPVLWLLVVVPGPWRDRLYDFIARRRYRWFGRQDACLLPTPATRARFLE